MCLTFTIVSSILFLCRKMVKAPPQLHNRLLKWLSLLVLLFQCTACVLILRYSRTQPIKGLRYLASTAVVCGEVIKLATCLLILLIIAKFDFKLFIAQIKADNFKNLNETMKVGIPALMYVVQNNLVFLALSKLDAATYQVTSQLKILTTAFFFVIMMKRKLHVFKWLALVILTVGIALAQLPNDWNNSSDANRQNAHDRLIGLAAVIAVCCSSGFAGVYFEKILKEPHVSIWMRNLQLAFFSIFGGLLMVWLYDMDAVSHDGFFQGYSTVIWIVVLLQAYGGLVVAMVVKYADNILKGFAVSLSIILSSIIAWLVMNDFKPTYLFILSVFLVVTATLLYSYEPTSEQKPSGKNPAEQKLIV